MKTLHKGTAMNKPSTQTNSQQLNDDALLQENRHFAGTAGISANNRTMEFIPAFMDTQTGNVYLSRFPNGMPAPIHILVGLPDSLTETNGASGAALSIKSSVISGFVREKIFYSREEAVQIAASGPVH